MSNTPKTTRVTTLIVGDQTPQSIKLRHALEASGFDVIEARDEPEAATSLLAVRPAVVLTDLRLSSGDGLLGVLRAAKGLDPRSGGHRHDCRGHRGRGDGDEGRGPGLSRQAD